MEGAGMQAEPERAGIEAELTRRGLIAGASAGALALAALMQPARALAADARALGPLPLAPDDPQVRATMAAFADTIVPGPAGKADASPGAIEAGRSTRSTTRSTARAAPSRSSTRTSSWRPRACSGGSR